MTALATADSTANAPIPFAFESRQVRTVINGDGNPWFVAKDAAIALGLTWTGHTLDAIPKGWVGVVKLTTPKNGDEMLFSPKGKGGWRPNTKITIISEPAVYKLAFRSNKPEADRFTNWVASEVIPALRRTGKYEVCPTPTPTRLTTAKERNALTGLVNRYVGLLPGGPHPEAYKAAWGKVHEVIGIGAIEELTVEQLPRAVMFVQSLLNAMVAPDPEPKALPAPESHTIRDYARCYGDLPEKPDMWRRLSFKAADAFDRFGKELDTIRDEAFAPFKRNRRSDVRTFLDEVMGPHYVAFRIADEQIRTAYRCIYEALDGLIGVHDLLRKG